MKTPEEQYNCRVGFYTLARLDKIEQLPQIVTDYDGSFKILGYLSADKCDTYLNDLLMADMSGTTAINGWIEDERGGNYQSNCQLIAQELLNRGSVGMTKYLDCAKIFFMHRDQIPSQWSQRFGFRTKKVRANSPFPRLAFILIYQPAKSSMDVSLLDKIVPQIIQPFQDFQHSSQQFQGQQRDFQGQQRDFRGGYNTQREERYESPRQPPVVNIKPEFLNMDSNSNTFSSYQGSQRHRFETSYNDPYNEPIQSQRGNFGGQSPYSYQNRNQNQRSRSPGGFQGRSFYSQPPQQQFRKPSGEYRPRQKPIQRGQYDPEEEVKGEEFNASTQVQDESLEPGEITGNVPRGPNRGGQRGSRSPNNVSQNPLYQEYLQKKSAGKTISPAQNPVIQKYLKPSKATVSSDRISKGISKPSDTNNLLLEDDLHYREKPQRKGSNQGRF